MMNRFLLLTLLTSLIGFSQNPIQPNHQNFNDDIPQGLVEKMNPFYLEFGDDGMMDINPTQRVSDMKLQSLQSEMMVENSTVKLDSVISLRYDNFHFHFHFDGSIYHKSSLKYDNNGNIILLSYFNFDYSNYNRKQENFYDDIGNLTLSINYYWDTESQSLFPSWKNEFNYDENGNTTLQYHYDWDTESQSFVLRYKYEFTYDENEKHILSIGYNWITESQSFVPSSKLEFTYDVNGNQTVRIGYSWNTDSQSFIPTGKYEQTWDNNGNQTLSIDYDWDTDSQSFVPLDKKEYTYDSNGNQTLYIRYNWNTEFQSFVPLRKRESTYDDNGNENIYIQYHWNTESHSFIPELKIELTYDGNGNRTNHISYSWDTTTQSFVPSQKIEYTYDSNGNENIFIQYHWNTESLSFVPIYKHENTYDNGNLKLQIRYNWDNVVEVFYERTKYIYSYDEFGNVLDYEEHNWIEQLGQMKPINKTVYSTLSETETNLVREGITYEYDTNFNTWNELEGEEFKSYWYYTKTPSFSTNSLEPNSFSIYPNPTSNSLHINSSESLSNPIFELYDVKGSMILSNPFKLTEPIDVSDLQPSMYIYNVKDGSEVKQSGKVIIE